MAVITGPGLAAALERVDEYFKEQVEEFRRHLDGATVDILVKPIKRRIVKAFKDGEGKGGEKGGEEGGGEGTVEDTDAIVEAVKRI